MAAGSPLLIAASKLAETEVRRILRRVTAPASRKEAKAAMRPLGRALAKIMHAQPIAVCEQLLRQVRANARPRAVHEMIAPGLLSACLADRWVFTWCKVGCWPVGGRFCGFSRVVSASRLSNS